MLYEKTPEEREISGFGFSLDDFAGEPVEVWPEHRVAMEIFMRMGTQWRVGMSGPTGLEYASLFAMMDRKHLSEDEYDEVFDAVRVMEVEALRLMREQA